MLSLPARAISGNNQLASAANTTRDEVYLPEIFIPQGVMLLLSSPAVRAIEK